MAAKKKTKSKTPAKAMPDKAKLSGVTFTGKVDPMFKRVSLDNFHFIEVTFPATDKQKVPHTLRIDMDDGKILIRTSSGRILVQPEMANEISVKVKAWEDE